MPYSNNSSFFVFQIFCKNRDKILKNLKKNKIGVSVHYTNPLPKMTYYKRKYKLDIKNFKNAVLWGKKYLKYAKKYGQSYESIKMMKEMIYEAENK